MARPAGGVNFSGIGWNVERTTESVGGYGGNLPSRMSVHAPLVYIERNITHDASDRVLPCQYPSMSLYFVSPFVSVLPKAPVKSFCLNPICTMEFRYALMLPT